MYLRHYGLNKMPFDISPDPSFLWFGEKHREALAHLKYGILGDKRFLLITGDVGTGKTALIKCIVKMIDVGAIVVTIPDPDMSRLDFYNFLANELNMGRQFNSKGEFLIHFKNFLLKAYRSHKKVLLIIDEANIFLVGQNEFKDLLMDDRNKSVRDRITASYQLEPLTETEVSIYIRHRLRVAGTINPIFSPDAVREVYLQTKGYPRLINILCDRALVSGYIKERQEIDAGIIKASARDLKITMGSEQPKKMKTPPPVESTAVPFNSPHERTFSLKGLAYINLFLILGFVVYFFGDSLFESYQHLKHSRIAARITDWIQGTEPDNVLVKKQGIIESSNALRPKESAELSSAVMPTSHSEQEQIITPKDVFKKIGLSGIAETPDRAGGTTGLPVASTGKKTSYVVYFDHSTDEIPPESLEVLNRITGIFFKSPVKDITLKGYTNSFGNENYDRYMSVERAMRVKNFFVGKGIPASSLNIYGMGSENPTDINTTAEERRKNRRVEIEVSLSQDPQQ
jgi:general secretion pathway protein A